MVACIRGCCVPPKKPFLAVHNTPFLHGENQRSLHDRGWHGESTAFKMIAAHHGACQASLAPPGSWLDKRLA